MLIEMIATTLDDALAIQSAGGHRIELVSAMLEGGLTPSLGLIARVSDRVTIPVNVMLRPHANGYLYSPSDIEVMKYDIDVILQTKANGFVVGILDEQNHINTKQLEQLLPLIKDRHITFHRAIDDSADLVEAIKILSQYPQIKTVLTSGGHGSFPERMHTILKMKEAAPNLELLIGSGITIQNIAEVRCITGIETYHIGSGVRKENSLILGVDTKRARELVTHALSL